MTEIINHVDLYHKIFKVIKEIRNSYKYPTSNYIKLENKELTNDNEGFLHVRKWFQSLTFGIVTEDQIIFEAQTFICLSISIENFKSRQEFIIEHINIINKLNNLEI